MNLNSLQQLKKDIGKYEPLSREEEIALGQRIKNGDNDAVNLLVLSNLRFAVKIANSYIGNGLDEEDVIAYAYYGLIKAAHKWDCSHKKKTKFISYAVYWIRQSIMEALSSESRLIRLPANKYQEIQKIQKKIKKSNGELKLPTHLDFKKPFSINTPYGDDGAEFGDILPDNSVEDVFEVGSDLGKDIQEILKVLDNRERIIVIKYLGLDGDASLTLQEIGEELPYLLDGESALTKERIRQIYKRAVLKLRSNAHILMKYYE